MTPKNFDRILQIYEQVRCGDETCFIWDAYEKSYAALYAWMDTLSQEEWIRIDDVFHNFFDVHLAMMEIALSQHLDQ